MHIDEFHDGLHDVNDQIDDLNCQMDFSDDAEPFSYPAKNKLEKFKNAMDIQQNFSLYMKDNQNKFKGRFRSMNKITDDKKVLDNHKNIFLATSRNLEVQCLMFKLSNSLGAPFFTMLLFMLFSLPLYFLKQVHF